MANGNEHTSSKLFMINMSAQWNINVTDHHILHNIKIRAPWLNSKLVTPPPHFEAHFWKSVKQPNFVKLTPYITSGDWWLRFVKSTQTHYDISSNFEMHTTRILFCSFFQMHCPRSLFRTYFDQPILNMNMNIFPSSVLLPTTSYWSFHLSLPHSSLLLNLFTLIAFAI